MNGEQVGSLYYDLDIDDSKLGAKLDEADSKVSGFGARLGKLGSAINDGMKEAAKGLAVAGAGLTLYAKDATDFTVGLVKSSTALGRQLGITTTEASRLVAATNRLGISAEDAAQMYGIFQKNIAQATDNSKQNQLANEKLTIQIDQTRRQIKATADEISLHGDKTGSLTLKLRDLNNTLASQQNQLKGNQDGFAKLGISTVDAGGKQKGFEQILFEVADRFKAMPNGIDKTAIALDLFGRSGKDMVKVLNLGADGIQNLQKKADELGLTLNAETITNVNELVESQKKLKEQTDALKIAVGTATAPVLTAFNTQLNNMVTRLVGTEGPIKDITTNLLAFGGPVSGALSTALGVLANISTISKALIMTVLRFTIVGAIFSAIAFAGYEVVKSMGGWGEVMRRIQPYLDMLNAGFDSLMATGRVALRAVRDGLDDVLRAVKLVITGDFRGGIFGLTEDDPVIGALLGVHRALVTVGNGFLEVVGFISRLVTPTLRLLGMAISVLVPPIMSLFGSLMNNLMPALFSLGGAIVKLWNAINPAFLATLGILAAAIGVALTAALWVFINVLNVAVKALSFVINIIASTISIIASLISWIWQAASAAAGAVGQIARWFGQLPSTIGSIVNSVVGWFQALPSRIGAAISGIAGTISAPFRAAFNAVAGLWNNSMGKLTFNVPGWVPGIGGRGWSLPKIPLLADGGVATRATLGVFGEAGTEAILPLSTLNRYSSLFDRIESTSKMLDNLHNDGGGQPGGNTTNFNGPINIYKDADADTVMAKLSRNQELARRGMTPLR